MREVAVDRPARLKLAELTSTIGAGVIGGAIGVLLAPGLASVAGAVLALGVLMHAWGMRDKHLLEARDGSRDAWWASALYITCWIALVAMLGYAALQPLGD